MEPRFASARKTLRLTIDSQLQDVAMLGAAIRAACHAAGVELEVADDTELSVVELVTNCIKHGYGGQSGHDIDVDLCVSPASVRIVIEDTAPGSPAQALLAAPLTLDFDEHDVDALPEGGMGLMLVKNLMDEVSHRRDGDRNITVLVRRLQPEPAALPPALVEGETHIDRAGARGRRPTSNVTSTPQRVVLAVDDDEFILRLLAATLRGAGYAVLTANVPEEALLLAATSHPDMILLDLMMPRIDGVTLAARLRADPVTADTPIILVTASVVEEAVSEAFNAGIDDYVTKPVNRPLLLARMAALFRARQNTHNASFDAELARDLAEASEVQQSLLPTLPMRDGRWQATGCLVPWGAVGGDAIDLMTGCDGSTIAVVVDVSGHGIAAALLAASVCSELRTLVQTRPLPESLLALNARIAANDTGKYACIAAIELHDSQVTIINAGLPPVLVLRRGRLVDTVAASATPLGLFGDLAIEQTILHLEPGDRLVMMSDGLTESFGAADDFGFCVARLHLTQQLWPLSLQPMAHLTTEVSALFDLVTPQHDDAALLVLEHVG